MPPVFALSMHADYVCGRSGACCTAGSAIPVEADRQATLGAAVLVPAADGACRFFDRSSHLCAVQRDHGEAVMPESCRHFPRLVLIDDRGIHVTLSHFCPTAAALLFRDDAPVVIQSAPPAFPPSRQYDGLDASGEWPPLVSRRLLFDYAAYDAWETFAVGALSREAVNEALGRLAVLAERLRSWTPADGPMGPFVDRITRSCQPDATALARYDRIRERARQLVEAAVPGALPESAVAIAHRPGPVAQRPAPGPDRPTPTGQRPEPSADHRQDSVLGRYLAAKAFASWTAYQGHGVRTLVAELVLADALVRDLATECSLLDAIRESDRCLVHLADRSFLLRAFDPLEDEP